MHEYTINGAVMTSREAAHAELKRALSLPDYYGANLDALWDMVSTMSAEVTLEHPAPLIDALRVYGCKLIQTLCEAATENPGFHFHVED